MWAPQEAAPGSSGSPDLAGAWPRILGLTRQLNPRAYGALNSSTGRFLRGDELTLNFASDIVKNQMEKAENLEALGKALLQIFQREITIHCHVDTAKRDAVPAGVDNDGMVAAALRDLGGEVVDIQ